MNIDTHNPVNTIETAPECAPPSALNTLLEVRAPLELLSLLPYSPKLLLAPRGDGRPVVLAPGFGANEKSLWPLGRYLKFLGYRVFSWGLGKNRGQVEKNIEEFGEVVVALHEQCQESLTLVGWSLGGVVSREVARLHDNAVREVITMGTPIIGGPKYTAIANSFAKKRNFDLDELEVEIHRRNSIGIKQPVTSIYSKSDGVVGWQASLDVYNEQANNVRVASSHLGLGVNPKTWLIIADLLAKKT